ncbi:MAG: response regulator transcription factor [Mycobacterium sp.]|nr:response regulator transcription factor [Mycobacterium sp.]
MHPSVLNTARELAQSRTVGTFIDESLRCLEESFAGSLVSFNRIDLAKHTGAVAFRPYRAELDQAVDGVGRLLDEHPLFRWYTSQPDWSPVRISDVMPWERFRQTRLLVEVLAPVGACHMITIMLVPPASGQLVYFGTTRADPDYTDGELELCRNLQPCLVALYTALALAEHTGPPGETTTLTRRERAVLGYLADGLTAEAIARRMSTRPATVRKHLQNLYAKLGTSDRLGAVIRSRDLGLLHADDLSREFQWNVRTDYHDRHADGDSSGIHR